MTATLPGADIRGYYAALGVHIADWARTEASVRCFAAPDAHHRGDHDPSCSINLEHGAWHCHGCGARGGAFDAATARGRSDRSAIDLMVAYGLTEYRAHRRARAKTRRSINRDAAGRPPKTKTCATSEDINRWRAALTADTDLIRALTRERGWLYATMLELELGVDRGRITIPVRDDGRTLVGLLRYQPWPSGGEPKMLATPGSRRALLPHPGAEPSFDVLLVEGEPDMIAARSRGLPAIAIPGVDSWRSEWAPLFANRRVTIVADADPQGRALAARVAEDLKLRALPVVLDLDPSRTDGYDLTDWLRDNAGAAPITTGELIARTHQSQ